MRKLHQQAKAREDLKNIWLYSFDNYGEEQADKYYDELVVGFLAIEENPHIGAACDYIRLGFRQYHINKHIVFYRLSAKKIHIVRVLHENMQFRVHL